MDAWNIVRLDKGHDRTQFDCGQPLLTDWIKTRVSQYEKRDLARTYVAVRPGQVRVWGYYAISTHKVSFEALPEDQAKGLPKISIPVILLGRLAVHVDVQRQGLGELMMIDVLHRARGLADEIGIRAVEVDAIDDKAAAFYERFGFTPLLDDPHHLHLPIQVIRKMPASPPRG